jgi:L-alanine-DL-glutamate epimerase-like enolase superfamily enzyme
VQGLHLTVDVENWPLARDFVISRGAKREARVVVAQVTGGGYRGRGECVPYARYGESVEGVAAAIGGMGEALGRGLSREALRQMMPPGAARNAIDCALWDYEAKAGGRRAAELAGLGPLHAVQTAFTISLGTPEAMAADAAEAAAKYGLLKLKLGGDGDAERLAAIRAAAPEVRLIADANEAWTAANLEALMAAAAAAGVEVIEQPLPADADAVLEAVAHPVPLCADESLHTLADLDRIARRYEAVNIKLDKAGGLTEALALTAAAKARGLKIMAGCMVATSLAMACRAVGAGGRMDRSGRTAAAGARPGAGAGLAPSGVIQPKRRAMG